MAKAEKLLSELKPRLSDGEQMIAYSLGSFFIEDAEFHAEGIMVVTNERVIFFNKGRKEEGFHHFSYDQIRSIKHWKQFTGHRINLTIGDKGRLASIKYMKKGEPLKILEHIKLVANKQPN